MKFYKPEIKDLFKSWIAISLVFSIANGLTLEALLFSTILVGAAFIVHELAHKYVAQKYGMIAYFKSFDNMLIFSVILSLLGLILIAPGAVMIRSYGDKIRMGRISAAGPFSNIILGLIFSVVYFFFRVPFFSYGIMINAWLALFNMIPFLMFDGKKILNWNKKVYLSLLISSLVLLFSIGFY